MFWTIRNVYRFLFARKFFIRLNRLLYACSLSGLGILNFESDKVSGEHVFIKRYFKHGNGGFVLDVGANVGDYTKAIIATDPTVKVVAFEPHPATFRKLCHNLNGVNARAHNVAVGDNKGIMALYDYENNDGSQHASLYKDVIENIHKSKSVKHEVQVITLDEFLNENSIEDIKLLKIDTEGHELAVLRGAKKHIDAGKIDIIHFEFNEMNVSSRTFFKDFIEILPEYSFFRLLPDGMVALEHYVAVSCEIFAYQNIVAIQKEKAKKMKL